MALAVSLLVSTDGPQPRGGSPVHLPTELVLAIFSLFPHGHVSQSTLYACLLVCRQWYGAGVAHLYHTPHLTPSNFMRFVATVIPMSSKSCVRGDQLAGFVRRLDMSRLVHDGKKCVTAKLLGRMKGGLEEFLAPAATFACADSFLASELPKTLTNNHCSVNCFAALSKCVRLCSLDLTLISVSISLSDLFHAIKALPRLQVLYFPRSSNYHRGFSVNSFSWPPNLRALTLAGGISDNFLLTAKNIPPTLDTLTIEYCPFAKGSAIRNLLAQLAPQLRNLKVSYHIPTLHYNALDQLLLICPQLHTLTVAVDYISSRFFDEENAPKPSHPLYLLSLESSGNLGVGQKIGPNDIYIAVCEGGLANLRQVRVSERLGWTSDEMKADVRDLVDLLEMKEEEDAKRDAGEYVESQQEYEESEEFSIWKGTRSQPRAPSSVKAGVWVFAS
jgi:F-box-like